LIVFLEFRLALNPFFFQVRDPRLKPVAFKCKLAGAPVSSADLVGAIAAVLTVKRVR
jgi:hypothetical protein